LSGPMLSRSAFNEALPQLLARLSGRLSWPMRLATVGAESDTPVMELQTSFLVAGPAADASDSAPVLVQVRLHIGFSSAYACPVLHFCLSQPDGVPLAASDAADFVRVNVESSTGEAAGQLDLASVLSQVPHPQLGCPMYTLHPCRTAELIGRLTSASEADRDGSGEVRDTNAAALAVLSWLTVYGRAVGLQVPPECFL
ncbi:hypothetical protein BOX15_Mlig004291g6, partial [Macrostomum lignano]